VSLDQLISHAKERYGSSWPDSDSLWPARKPSAYWGGAALTHAHRNSLARIRVQRHTRRLFVGPSLHE